jgi:hypothetical protein
MSIAVEPPQERRTMTESGQRRWRLAALIALAALLTLAAIVVVLAEQEAQANRVVPMLVATRDIPAGATISDDELRVVSVHVDDGAVIGNLTPAGDRSRLAGQVAVDGVRAGALIPAGLAAPAATANLWDVPLSVKQRPPDLKAGDHVALLVSGTGRSGQPEELVAAQDVVVLAVDQDTVTAWLPAADAAQMELYASHGDMVVARMRPGAVQNDLPQAGGN